MLIKGQITDYNGEPIHLASVSIKGSNPLIGVSTDFDGNYAINVNPGQILEFSYVGNAEPVERLVKNNDAVINVTMVNQLMLNENIVIGDKPKNKSWIWWLLAFGVGAVAVAASKPKPKKIII